MKKAIQIDIKNEKFNIEVDVPDELANIELRYIVGVAPVFQLSSFTFDQAVKPTREVIEPITDALFAAVINKFK